MYSFPIILQQIKAKNEQRKSEGATVARLSQTGYSTDSDFFFGSDQHLQATATQIRCKTVVYLTRKRLARLVSNLANTGKLVARPPVFVASCFCAAFSALEFPTFLPEMLGKTWGQLLPVYY